MPQPKVSIIVPVYNAERYLTRCITSIQNQTLEEIEVVLVDDSSTDASLELCNNMAEQDPRIKVIHKENGGAGYARNAALEVASGEFIGFVDSDDYVAPEMFETLYETAVKYDSDLVLSGVVFVDGTMFGNDGACEKKVYFPADTVFENTEDLQELRMGIIGATPKDADDSKYGMSIWKNLFRHDIIQAHHLRFVSEREMLSEDALFMVDFISHIKRAVGISGAFYHYCRNGESISKSYKKDRFEKSLVFLKEAERRFEDLDPTVYQVYLGRFWQAMCRVICSQEILHAKKASDLNARLKEICTHPLTVQALTEYPINTLPMGQRVFAYAMKYRLYLLLKVLVGLRNR